MRLSSLEDVNVTFRNENDAGVLEDMTYLPTAQLYVDGALDSDVSVIVTRIGVGTYRASWTMGNYNVNDIWELVVTGWYGGVSYTRIVKEGYIGEASFVGASRFTRLEAFFGETPTISFYCGNYDLDEKIIQIKVGTGQYNESAPLGDLLYTFNDGNITRDNNLVTITIPATITNNIGIYPFALYDITTGNSELLTGVIDVVQTND